MPQDMASLSKAVPQLFELTRFLEGRTHAWGVFEDRFGRLRRRLSVDMYGRWLDGVFVLSERFEYDGDAVELRTWRVTPTGNGRFSASCPELVGDATGICSIDSVRMAYRFRLKLEAREIVVTFDDRLYRVGETMAVNRATMRKWGVTLGEVSLFVQRVPGEVAPEAWHKV